MRYHLRVVDTNGIVSCWTEPVNRAYTGLPLIMRRCIRCRL